MLHKYLCLVNLFVVRVKYVCNLFHNLMCVYSRSDLPELPDLPSYSEGESVDVEKLADAIQLDYLAIVTGESFSASHTMFTSDFKKMRVMLSQCPSVAITGPKGCGKTVLCVAMYLMLQRKLELDCLYLTRRSFQDDTTCVAYFQAFYEKHKDCFDEEIFRHDFENLSSSSKKSASIYRPVNVYYRGCSHKRFVRCCNVMET